MEPARRLEPNHLELRRTFNAPRAAVFAALTEPDQLRQWWAATREHVPCLAEVDLRVGGAYRLGMRAASGNEHIVGGTFREITEPERLVYTWRWESSPDFPETLVTITLDALAPDRTELHLVHELLPSEEAANQHRQGWTGCFDHLQETF